jgi:hypothetical protein
MKKTRVEKHGFFYFVGVETQYFMCLCVDNVGQGFSLARKNRKPKGLPYKKGGDNPKGLLYKNRKPKRFAKKIIKIKHKMEVFIMKLFKGKTFKKAISAVITVLMMLSGSGIQYVFAEPAALAVPSAVSAGILLAPEQGRVLETYKGSSQQIVYCIQDLHCHKEVQNNIADILGVIRETYGPAFNTIFVEGSWSSLNTKLVKSLPNGYGIKEKIISDFMNAGLFTGVEKYDFMSKDKMRILGIEDKDMYKLDASLLVDSFGLRNDALKAVSLIQNRIDLSKQSVFSKDQIAFETLVKKYQDKKINVVSYIKALKNYADRLGIYFDLEYRNLAKVPALADLRMRIGNIAGVRKEAELLIRDIKDEMTDNEKAMLNKLKNENNSRYYLYLGKIVKNKDIYLGSNYAFLESYLNYLNLSMSVNTSKLVDEESRLQNDIRTFLAVTKEQKDMVELEKSLNLVKNFISNSVTYQEASDFMNRQSEIFGKIESIIKNNSSYIFWNTQMELTLPKLKEAINTMWDFYSVAVDRNRALVTNTLKNNVPVSVMVVGGYHTKGITELLKSKNISYVLITPNITQDVNTAIYENIIKAQAGVLSGKTTGRTGNQSLAQIALTDTSLNDQQRLEIAKGLGLQVVGDQIPVKALADFYASTIAGAGGNIPPLYVKDANSTSSSSNANYFNPVVQGDKVIVKYKYASVEGTAEAKITPQTSSSSSSSSSTAPMPTAPTQTQTTTLSSTQNNAATPTNASSVTKTDGNSLGEASTLQTLIDKAATIQDMGTKTEVKNKLSNTAQAPGVYKAIIDNFKLTTPLSAGDQKILENYEKLTGKLNKGNTKVHVVNFELKYSIYNGEALIGLPDLQATPLHNIRFQMEFDMDFLTWLEKHETDEMKKKANPSSSSSSSSSSSIASYKSNKKGIMQDHYATEVEDRMAMRAHEIIDSNLELVKNGSANNVVGYLNTLQNELSQNKTTVTTEQIQGIENYIQRILGDKTFNKTVIIDISGKDYPAVLAAAKAKGVQVDSGKVNGVEIIFAGNSGLTFNQIKEIYSKVKQRKGSARFMLGDNGIESLISITKDSPAAILDLFNLVKNGSIGSLYELGSMLKFEGIQADIPNTLKDYLVNTYKNYVPGMDKIDEPNINKNAVLISALRLDYLAKIVIATKQAEALQPVASHSTSTTTSVTTVATGPSSYGLLPNLRFASYSYENINAAAVDVIAKAIEKARPTSSSSNTPNSAQVFYNGVVQQILPTTTTTLKDNQALTIKVSDQLEQSLIISNYSKGNKVTEEKTNVLSTKPLINMPEQKDTLVAAAQKAGNAGFGAFLKTATGSLGMVRAMVTNKKEKTDPKTIQLMVSAA